MKYPQFFETSLNDIFDENGVGTFSTFGALCSDFNDLQAEISKIFDSTKKNGLKVQKNWCINNFPKISPQSWDSKLGSLRRQFKSKVLNEVERMRAKYKNGTLIMSDSYSRVFCEDVVAATEKGFFIRGISGPRTDQILPFLGSIRPQLPKHYPPTLPKPSYVNGIG